MRVRAPRPLRRALRRRRAGSPAPFVVGAARSGTTMLRLMLDSHPELAIGPETSFVLDAVEASRGPDDDRAAPPAAGRRDHRPPPLAGLRARPRARCGPRSSALDPFSPADAVRTFYRAYAAQPRTSPAGATRPRATACGCARSPRILPEAHFIHLIRDGRDVRLSQLASGRRPADRRQARPALEAAGDEDARARERAWPTTCEVRFEDLVADPERELRRDLRVRATWTGTPRCSPSTSGPPTAWPRSTATSTRAEELGRRRGSARRPRAGPQAQPHHRAAAPRPRRRLADRDERLRLGPSSSGSPGRCWPSSATRSHASAKPSAAARTGDATPPPHARLGSTLPAPFVVGAGRVRDDDAAADARRPPRARGPARDALPAAPVHRRRGPTGATPALRSPRCSPPSAAGRDFGLDRDELERRFASPRPCSPRAAPRAASTAPTPPATTSRAGATRRPRYVLNMAPDRTGAARGPVRPPDPRRPRRPPLAAQPHRLAARRPRSRRAAGAGGSSAAAPGRPARRRRLPRGPLRGPGRRPRARAAADLRARATSTGTRRCWPTTTRAAERMGEIAAELPRRPRQNRPGERLAAQGQQHARAGRAAGRRLAPGDGPGGARRPTSARPAGLLAELGYAPAAAAAPRA